MPVRPKIKQLILHAGLPKTATTTIQNTLFKCRESLLNQGGVLYPGFASNHSQALCTAFLSDPRRQISNKMAGRDDLSLLRKEGSRFLITLQDEIEKLRPERVLLSAEGMSNLSAIDLANFVSWAQTLADDVLALYITRNPIDYCASVMQQNLKSGRILEEMYENPPLPNFKVKLGNAIRAFKKNNVMVRTFEDMRKDGEGVIGFFLSQISINDARLRSLIISNEVRANESLSYEAALILSSLNKQRPAIVNGKRGLRRTMHELRTFSSIEGKKFQLPRHVASRVATLSAPDNAWLRDFYGIDSYMDSIAPSSDYGCCLSSESIDSIALLFSDLLNFKYTNELVKKAERLRDDSSDIDLLRFSEEIKRISPNTKLPLFLQNAYDNRNSIRSIKN